MLHVILSLGFDEQVCLREMGARKADVCVLGTKMELGGNASSGPWLFQ